jgi:hypothetical protein
LEGDFCKVTTFQQADLMALFSWECKRLRQRLRSIVGMAFASSGTDATI